jgi:hypothetical protein
MRGIEQQFLALQKGKSRRDDCLIASAQAALHLFSENRFLRIDTESVAASI